MRSADQRCDGNIDQVDSGLGLHPSGNLRHPRDQKGQRYQYGAENQHRQIPRWLIDPTRLAPGQEAGTTRKRGHGKNDTPDAAADAVLVVASRPKNISTPPLKSNGNGHTIEGEGPDIR